MRFVPLMSVLSLLMHLAAAHADGPNVILLTMDGVRWEEVFHDAGLDSPLKDETR
jgi:hypothetical protein